MIEFKIYSTASKDLRPTTFPSLFTLSSCSALSLCCTTRNNSAPAFALLVVVYKQTHFNTVTPIHFLMQSSFKVEVDTMCKTMSPKRKCTSDDMVMDSPSNTFHDRISNDNGDFYGSSDEKSLEDTLSLTCDDESLTSRSEDNTLEESSVVELSMYQSPALLRKRLPLALSPILGNDYGGESPMSYRNKLKSQTLWKKRSTVRILCFSVSILAYLFSTTLNYPSMITSIRGARLSKQSQEWNRFLRRKAPKIMKKMPSKSSNPQYTIRIKGRRLDLVLQSLDYHAQCPSVKNVQVEWTDPALKQLPKSVLKHKSGKVQAYGKSKTPAVFLLDEDILLKCDEIERGTTVNASSI